MIAGDQVVVTRKELRGKDSYEGLARIDSKKGDDKDGALLAWEKAGYLDAGKGGGVALTEQATASLGQRARDLPQNGTGRRRRLVRLGRERPAQQGAEVSGY